MPGNTCNEDSRSTGHRFPAPFLLVLQNWTLEEPWSYPYYLNLIMPTSSTFGDSGMFFFDIISITKESSICLGDSMKTYLIVNSKGGTGKTTVSTNVASYYAAKGFKTAIMDYDPQGSSLHWLENRPHSASPIFASNAAKQKNHLIRSWQMNVPSYIERLIIDAPAGVEGLLLQELVKRTDTIIIPVGPSSIDIHATADFIKDLFLVGKARHLNTRICVIANRVRRQAPLYKPLEKFLNSLKIPFVTKLSDSDNYIEAVEMGLGIYDLDDNVSYRERTELEPLFQWLESGTTNLHPPKQNNIVSLSERKRTIATCC